MKIVIALDSFKGTLTAPQACKIVADIIAELLPNAHIVLKPMADGGEGTADAMIQATNGKWLPARVTGPLPQMQVNAGFAWFENSKTALVEMASASGLTLLKKDQLNPMKTTTLGTGELIKKAAALNPQKILLAVGGSATTDGGIGAASALGWKFLDKNSNPVPPSGQGLEQITKIVAPPNLKLPPVEVMSDVLNPLTGLTGAAEIFGLQKGATPAMVQALDIGLKNLATIVRKDLGRELENIPCYGAAGGLAAGAVAFMNAKIVSGIETVILYTHLKDEIKDADWLITGEGCFDKQSLMGKVVWGITNAAASTNAKLAVIAGQIKLGKKDYQKAGISAVESCIKENMSLDHALANSKSLLASAAKRLAHNTLLK